MQDERYQSAGLVLWLIGALNVFGGVVLLVGSLAADGGLQAVLGGIYAAAGVLFGVLGFAARKGSQTAVVIGVIALGLVLAVRVVPLMTGGFQLGSLIGIVITAFALFVVGRPLLR